MRGLLGGETFWRRPWFGGSGLEIPGTDGRRREKEKRQSNNSDLKGMLPTEKVIKKVRCRLLQVQVDEFL